jgi:iron complex outermembrane recepter protein
VIPAPGLSISASIEGLTGAYTSFPNGLFNVYNRSVGGNCTFVSLGSCAAGVLPPNFNPATGSWDLRGNHTIQTPPFSANLIVQYGFPVAEGEVNLTFSWSHTGNYYADVDNGLGQVAPSSPRNDEQSLVNLLNASMGWSSDDKRWRILLWGKNLSGQKYWAFAFEDALATQFTAAPPRTFGITIGRHWQ